MIRSKIFSIHILQALALVGFLIPLVLSLANYLNLVQLAVTFPYPLDYGEGPLLDQVLRLAQGENIYRNDLSVPPYTVSNYPPVFLLVQVPFFQVFGPAFWYGRLISLFGALLAACLIGLTLHCLTREWIASLIGGTLLLAFPYTQYWSVLDRIDLLALALSWAAIFITVRWSERRWGIPAAALFFVLSIFTRQSYALAAPLGAFFWLMVSRQVRRAFLLAALTAGACLALFLMLNGLTRGGFYLNIVSANVNPFYWETVRRHIREISGNTVILLCLTIVYLLVERTGQHTRAWPLALAYLAGASLSAVTIGKDGSNVNYLLELAAALSFCSGAFIAWIGKNPRLRLAAVALLIAQVFGMLGWTQAEYNGRITEKTNQQAAIARLAEAVKNTEGIVLADEYMGLLPLAGKRLYFQPFEFKMLEEGGLWNERPFLVSIKNKEFGAILQYQPGTWPAIESRWTPLMRSAIGNYYDQAQLSANTWILVPEP